MKIHILKLGGASCNKETFSLLRKIILREEKKDNFVLVVVSALEGVTRQLNSLFEVIVGLSSKDEELKKLLISLILKRFQEVHSKFISELFQGENFFKVIIDFEKIFLELKKTLNDFKKEGDEDRFYAELVKYGEICSSMLLSSFLSSFGHGSFLFDVRDYIFTDKNYRQARVLNTDISFINLFSSKSRVLVTQGFIGRNNGQTTTLGFDGSDLSAAVLAVAASLSKRGKVLLEYWKNVDGFYKKDPLLFPNQKNIRRRMSLSEYRKLPTHPIRLDSVEYAIKNGLVVNMRSFKIYSKGMAKIYG